MANSTQSPGGLAQEFRVPRAAKEEFLRRTGEVLRPFRFIVMEREEGETAVLLVIPASSEPILRERLQQLASDVQVGHYASGQAEAESDF